MSATSEGIKAASAPQAEPALPGLSPRLVAALRRHYLAGIISVVGGLAFWELISRYVIANALFLAAPSQIAVAIVNLGRSGQLWHHVSVSSAEFALGYVIANLFVIGVEKPEPARAVRGAL